MTTVVIDYLLQEGFEQYEISNFARKNHRSLHNETYWDHRNYIGLGCAAHSYLHPYRWANVSDFGVYLEKISGNKLPRSFSEFIDTETLAKEMLFLGLRRSDGIDTEVFEKRTGKEFSAHEDMKKIEAFISKGWLQYRNSRYLVTPSGLLFADTMARELF